MADFTNINGVDVKDEKAREDLQVLSDYVDTIIPIGRTETVLWENTGTTNPETITLSDAWSNFDELVIVTTYIGSTVTQSESTNHTSIMAIGGIYNLWFNSDSTWGTYSVTSSTVFTKTSAGGDYHIAKIIGCRYTKVNPSGYREIELYSNDEHAATPIDTVLTLSQNWADFDAIGFVSEYNDEVGLCAYNEYKVSVISAADRIALNFDIGSGVNSFIFIGKNASNSFVVSGLNTSGELSHVYKIIGIKY